MLQVNPKRAVTLTFEAPLGTPQFTFFSTIE